MWNKTVPSQAHMFLGCEASYEDARIVLFGAPFDGTTSFRPGARFACAAMRRESWGLETYSPYQDKDLVGAPVCDSGDIEVPIGSAEATLRAVERVAGAILDDGKIPFMVGGEHLVTLGTVRALAAREADLHVLHVDAHADLRDTYLGVSLSHACVMRRAWELLGDGRIHQFGIRSGERSEFAWGKAHTDMHLFTLDDLQECVSSLCGMPVYVSIDLDVLDPSVFPGTGTPEPGGVSFMQLLGAVQLLAPLSIVGADVVELSPPYDASGASTAAACKIVRELLLTMST